MSTATAIAPQTIDHFIGARNIVERVKVALEAMWNVGGSVFPHTLLLGPPGMGKTEMSNIIAREMGVPMVEALGQTIDTPEKMNSMLLQAEGGCLFVDEIHSLPGDVQVGLLKVLQEGRLFLPCSSRQGTKATFLDLKPFCLLAATTDEWALSRPLVDRFRMILRFDYYSIEEMTLLVSRRASALTWELAAGVAESIASRSKGTPRIGIRLLENCIRTAQAQAESVITDGILNRTCDLEQLDTRGLDAIEQKYLRLLADAGGILRVNVLSSCLGLPRQTLEKAIEPYLIRERLIEKTEAGRCVTEIGRRHLDCPNATASTSA